jgi:hypothetical protein
MPIPAALIAALVSGGFDFAGGLLGDDKDSFQPRQSFSKYANTDPRALLDSAVRDTNTIGKAITERSKNPVQLRSRAVSSVGRPSSIDPALLRRPGLDFGAEDPFGPLKQEVAVPRTRAAVRRRPS